MIDIKALKISDTDYYNASIERLGNEANNPNEYAIKRLSARELKRRFMAPLDLLKVHFNLLCDLLVGMNEDGALTPDSLAGLIKTGIPSHPTLYDLFVGFGEGTLPDAIVMGEGETLHSLLEKILLQVKDHGDALEEVDEAMAALDNFFEKVENGDFKIELDDTLTQKGLAADAKAVGDAMEDLSKVYVCDLTELGLPNIQLNGGIATVQTDTTNLFRIMKKHHVRFVFSADYNGLTFTNMNVVSKPQGDADAYVVSEAASFLAINGVITIIVEPDKLSAYGVVLEKNTNIVKSVNGVFPDANGNVTIDVRGNCDCNGSAIAMDYDTNVKAINHRGYSTEAPENTIPAYILSKQKGFAYAECDVSFTSDGVAVLLHDATIDRTSDGSGNINSLTLADVRQYDFGSWKSSVYTGTLIPTFEEFIMTCKAIGLHPYIEFKSNGGYTQDQILGIVSLVKKAGMEGKVTYISFNATFLGYVKNADPKARLGYLADVTEATVATAIALKTEENEVFMDVKYSNVTVAKVDMCIDADLPLEIWTVNSENIIHNMNSYVTGVTSDNLIAGQVLYDKYMSYTGAVPATSLTLSATDISLEQSDTFTLIANVLPANTTDKVTWNSSNTSVATVENGVVTWRAAGECTITASISNRGLTATCSVNCIGATAYTLALEQNTLTLPVEGSATIVAYLHPANEEVLRQIVWSSDDTSVATVENGVVTWVGYGTCTITASIPAYGLSASCFVRTEAQETDIMSYFKYLGPTTYSPGTYTAWCPTGLIYDETRDVYVQMMNVQNRHGATPNACELWCNTIDPYTLEHTKPVFIARTGEMQSGSMTSYGALGCCVKNGVYYMFSKNERGYYQSVDGGLNWTHETYETGPDANAWGCYVLSNGRMIMGSDTNNHKVYYSDDDGKNWTTVQSEHFNEPTFIDFGNGTLMAICRENKDSANNLKHPWMHVSYDNGETWTASVEMTSVGYMGNNNCNAYVHDSYVELFVGCRNWDNSPQWDEKYYKITQYVLDLNKGPVDEFEFVNEVYAFKDGENPQNNLMKSQLTADDFSTPVIAIKDKSHALLTFYGPVAYGVTHHMIAVGNLPVDDFEIPSIIPDSYKASQTFSGNANDSTITVCGSYGITPYGNYPTFSSGYLNFSDIEDGGFVHVKVLSRGYADAYGTTWISSAFNSVADGIIKSASRPGGLGYSPMPTNPTKVLSGGAFGKRTAIPNGGELDRYAFIDQDCWWIYNDGTWFSIRNGDVPIENLTYSNISSTPELEPYQKEGLTSYKILVGANANLGILKQIEYDKRDDKKVQVTNNLTNVTTSNSANTVSMLLPYRSTLAVDKFGCELGGVSVVMNGVDVTSTVYSDGNILIPTITGDIEITANAVQLSKGALLHNWDFTAGLTDSVGGKVATLSAGATQSTGGVTIPSPSDYVSIDLGEPITNKYYEIDVAEVGANSNTNHKRFFMSAANNSDGGLIYRKTGTWSIYSKGTAGNIWDDFGINDINAIQGKTVTCLIDNNYVLGTYVNGALWGNASTNNGTNSTGVSIGSPEAQSLECTITGLRIYEAST